MKQRSPEEASTGIIQDTSASAETLLPYRLCSAPFPPSAMSIQSFSIEVFRLWGIKRLSPLALLSDDQLLTILCWLLQVFHQSSLVIQRTVDCLYAWEHPHGWAMMERMIQDTEKMASALDRSSASMGNGHECTLESSHQALQQVGP